MIKRIKSLISVKNLTPSQFADLLGVQRSNISHILSGRNKPSLDFILKITEHFPAISIEWLIKGKGEMFSVGEESIQISPAQLDIQVDSTLADREPQLEFSDNTSLEDVVENESARLENANDILSSIALGEPKREDVLADDAKEDGIEKIMVLYKNGSFRVYIPQK